MKDAPIEYAPSPYIYLVQPSSTAGDSWHINGQTFLSQKQESNSSPLKSFLGHLLQQKGIFYQNKPTYQDHTFSLRINDQLAIFKNITIEEAKDVQDRA